MTTPRFGSQPFTEGKDPNLRDMRNSKGLFELTTLFYITVPLEILHDILPARSSPREKRNSADRDIRLPCLRRYRD